MPNLSGLLVQADEGILLPVVDLIKEFLPPPTMNSQIPCEFGWSQAPRRQQVDYNDSAFKLPPVHQLTPAHNYQPVHQLPPITCVTLNGSGIQLAVGPQPLWLRNNNSGPAQWIMVKRLATLPHDPLGITDSACKNQSVMVSVQYGPFYPYIPIRSTTIGKSRVARDPIAMHTSWRSNSDIASVTSIGYPRMSASGESSTTMHRLLHASGSHPIPMPYDSRIGRRKRHIGKGELKKPWWQRKKSAWADSDSEESSSGASSSSDSEDEVQCLMADDTEEVFNFSNPEFTREDLVTALNEMVLEHKKLSQSFKEFKAEEESCATSA
ncbi:hypothetical protein F511_23846 [Dorcoceras hygrometricum]|uniref:Uncharacterized protein n=1 Tax=Dorcoceras hygrometricum TaxID=472368 RepID=A0A2Z7CDE9_9LAMI|nr:hypothetical protein F511_23846 [Dorcoceras hygrometricum]